jgi:hypothetical protein
VFEWLWRKAETRSGQGQAGAFSSQVESLGGSENATQGQAGAFSSQVESLGGSENATKQGFSVLPVRECERETH